MKKLFAFIAVFGMLLFGASFYTVAQEETDETTVEQADTMEMEEAEDTMEDVEEEM